ncbi:MAG: TIR domain-containing protein [Saprospiraceae bacterium]|nr:TIR domain-containing protein [Saprospiraceae bacterium]
MADIFISYSSEDKSTVRQIAGLLEAKGWSVWWDRQIPIGERFDTVIENELHSASCVIVVWTERSIKSEWVKNEASEAASKRKLVPIVLENVPIPLAFRRIESAMMKDWDGESDHPELEILYDSISKILNQSSDAPPIRETPLSDSFETRKKRKSQVRIASLMILILFSVVTLFYFLQEPTEAKLAVRVFDWKNNPLTQGEVKIYLKDNIRTQSIDNNGQALFVDLPNEVTKRKLKIEISSIGYATKIYDTLIAKSTFIEFRIPFVSKINISGKVKTAAEYPIKGVDVIVEGTKYFDKTKNDGSFLIRLDEYTIGDEIEIVTSHPNYEDKISRLKIISPDMKNIDLYLNPVTH